jgi:glycosyltransferase involved in cell wall biosynthesis
LLHEDFNTLSPYDIGVEGAEVHRMAMIYDLKEFATALKPSLLRTLAGRGDPDVLYFDPDIWIFEDLQDVSASARSYAIVLTPHARAPFPRDGYLPDERMILRAGVFNLGFIGINAATAQPFLDWWSERLARECRVAIEEALFVDQRWVDFVPVFFDHRVLSDPTLNVAYWNLHERQLRWTGRRYEVEGTPLRFFHFSGFDPKQPDTLSSHTGTVPRIRLADHPAVERLCAEYASRLFEHGFGRDAHRYRFDVLSTGKTIGPDLRRVYREALLKAESGRGALPPDPFDPVSADALEEWLAEAQAGRATAIPGQRRRARLIDLSRRRGRELRAASSVATAAAARTDALVRPYGVNIIGYLEAELGLGEIARKLVTAAEAADIPTATVTCRSTVSRQGHPFESRGGNRARYRTNIICVNADKLPDVASKLGPAELAGRYTAGVWFWEVAHFPEHFHGAFDLVDEVWVASDFVREAIAPTTDKPVYVVPIPLEPPALAPRSREALDLPDGFLFFFSFDYFSVFERKNPLATVEAFKRAFEPGDGASLLIKSINGDWHESARERLRSSAEGRPDIRIMDGYVAPAEQHALMAACDCYVSLHRSEGFGLTMAEAMALAKPVIATGYSGNLTFMNAGNSYLVQHDTAITSPASAPYPPGIEWADPDVDHAAELMRGVFDSPGEARRIGQCARRDVSRHTLDRTAAFVRERLDSIPSYERFLLSARAPLDHAFAAVSKAPGGSLEGSRSSAGSVVRKLFRRVLWPELVEQRQIALTLAESLRAVVVVTREQFERIERLERRIEELLDDRDTK